MALQFYTLLADAEFIRDTDIRQSNTAEFVGKWCVDCTRYIEGPAALNAIAEAVRAETVVLTNNARRMGTWCFDALRFVGIRAGDGKQETYDDLYLRAIEIRDEYREQLNEPRLGRWFYDFLFYIDYEGDTDPGGVWLLNISIASLAANVFILPVYADNSGNVPEVYIDWGDGSSETTVVDTIEPISHTYAATGSYQVLFFSATDYSYGSVDFSRINNTTLRRRLTGIELFGAGANMTRVSFDGCTNLSYINPDQDFAGLSTVTSMGYFFRYCSRLTSVPDNMFSQVPTGITIAIFNFFEGTSSLSAVPDTLFSRISNVSSISYLFRSSGIRSISGNFFSGIRESEAGSTINATSCFAGCSYLESIGADFFRPFGSRLNNVSSCFERDIRLTSVPETLFQANTGVTTFAYTFRSSGILSIPEILFATNTAVTTFSGTFGGTPITTVPATLFAACTRVRTFDSCFSGCLNLSNVPYNLFINNRGATDYSYTFYQTQSLQTFDARLFSYATFGQSFNSTFERSGLVSIPERAFANCQDAQTFASCFRDCASLTTLPTTLFPNSVEGSEIAMDSIFRGTTSLRTLPSTLFSNCGGVYTMTYGFANSSIDTPDATAFNGLSRLSAIEGLFQNCPNITRVRKAWFDSFAGGLATRGPVSLASLFEYTSPNPPQSPLVIESNAFDWVRNRVTTVSRCFAGDRRIEGEASDSIRMLFANFYNVAQAGGLWAGVRNFSFGWYRISSTPYPGQYALMFPNSGGTMRSITSMFEGTTLYATSFATEVGEYGWAATPPPTLNLTNITRGDAVLRNSKIIGVPASGSFIYYVPSLISQSVAPSVNASYYMNGAIAGTQPNSSLGFTINVRCMPAGVTNLNFAFANLINAAGRTPNQSNQVEGEVELWNRAGTAGYPAAVSGTQCFRNSTGFTNYSDIPADWK